MQEASRMKRDIYFHNWACAYTMRGRRLQHFDSEYNV